MAILDFVEKYVYGALFGLIFVEELGIPLPVPGDAILLYLGIKSLDGLVLFGPVLAISMVATLLGSSALYFIARFGGRPLLEKYQGYLRYVHVTPKDIDNLEHYMAHYGFWVLIVARLTPGLRTLGTIAAGVLGVSYKRFLLATLTATVVWVTALYWAGFFLGRQFAHQIEAIFGNKFLLAGLFVLGILIWLGLFKWLYPTIQRHRHKSEPNRQILDEEPRD